MKATDLWYNSSTRYEYSSTAVPAWYENSSTSSVRQPALLVVVAYQALYTRTSKYIASARSVCVFNVHIKTILVLLFPAYVVIVVCVPRSMLYRRGTLNI